MFKAILAAVGVVGAGLWAAPAQESKTPAQETKAPAQEAKVSAAERKFMMAAADGDMLEVEAGKLAQQKAMTEAVKQFANRMVDDHTKANEELKQVASSSGVSLPDQVSARHRKHLDKLSKLSGGEFDQAYMRMMVKDHEKAVRLYEQTAAKAADGPVKTFAQQTLPTLQEHLKLAKDVAGKIGLADVRPSD